MVASDFRNGGSYGKSGENGDRGRVVIQVRGCLMSFTCSIRYYDWSIGGPDYGKELIDLLEILCVLEFQY